MATGGEVNERLSPQFLLDCDVRDEMGCGGGALDNVWHYLTDGSHGTVTLPGARRARPPDIYIYIHNYVAPS
jgi:hypothetical protein